MSNFDAEKFRKVFTLAQRGATAGERDNARAAATKMAQKASMTLDQAVQFCGMAENPAATRSETADWREAFRDIFDTPEFRAEQAERQHRDEAKRKEILKEYGSEDAVFAETDLEALLSRAVDHLKEWKAGCDVSGEPWSYVSKLDGVDSFYRFEQLTPSILDAIKSAIAVPDNLVGLLEEYRYWEKLHVIRDLFCGWEHALWVQARQVLLGHFLDTKPVQNWQDMQARLGWWQIALDREMHHADGWEQALKDRIAEDIIILQKLSPTGVQSGQQKQGRRTNADKGELVVDLLRRYPHCSNRAIAEMAGVSPQTVLNWRNRSKFHGA
jgi:hypothetical protein